MDVGTVIIFVFILVLCIFGIKSYLKRLTSGCCGSGGGGKEKKVKVEDRDLTHYPITGLLSIDGMTCGNCVRRVENALNRLEGVWAEVSLSEGKATVHMKKEIEEAELRKVLREAGYALLSIKEVN